MLTVCLNIDVWLLPGALHRFLKIDVIDIDGSLISDSVVWSCMYVLIHIQVNVCTHDGTMILVELLIRISMWFVAASDVNVLSTGSRSYTGRLTLSALQCCSMLPMTEYILYTVVAVLNRRLCTGFAQDPHASSMQGLHGLGDEYTMYIHVYTPQDISEQIQQEMQVYLIKCVVIV